MLPERRTSTHNTHQHDARPKRQNRNMTAPLPRPLANLPALVFLPRKFIQPLALPRHPIRDMQFLRVDVALGLAVLAQEEEAG